MLQDLLITDIDATHAAMMKLDSVPVRSKDLGRIDGQEAETFHATHENLLELDREIFDIHKKLYATTAKKKQLMEPEEERLKYKHEELATNSRAIKTLQGEWSAFNKIIKALKSFFGFFSSRGVALETAKPSPKPATDQAGADIPPEPVDDPEADTLYQLDDLDAHFDVGQIIGAGVTASATLTFKPPEFYEVERDMGAQLRHMHCTTGLETPDRDSFLSGAKLVRDKAKAIQPAQPELTSRQELTEEQQRAAASVALTVPTVAVVASPVQRTDVSKDEIAP